MGDRAPGRRSRRVLIVLGAVVAVVTGLSFLPPVQARGKAVAVVADALGLPFPRPLAPAVTREETTIGGVEGDLYVPDGPAPPILLLHGAAPKGKDDPRLVRLAFAVARAGRVVFVPGLHLADQEFVADDLDLIVRAGSALAEDRRASGKLVLLGISYGGSFGLVASVDPRLSAVLSQVAVFGAYFDLVGVIQAITTGVSLVRGARVPWKAHPRADEIFERVAVRLAAERSRDAVRAVLRGDAKPGRLRGGSRAVYDLVTNRDPARTFEIAGRLPAAARERLARFSPSSVAERIRVPVIALHSRDDPAVPFGEAVRLVRGIPGTRLVTVGSFTHVDFAPAAWAQGIGDLIDTWRFTSWMLGPQE